MIVGGVLDVPGASMYDKMCYLRDHADGLRKAACSGSRVDTGNQLQPRVAAEAHPGRRCRLAAIMEQVEYPGMSGTNTICVVTVLLETGMLPCKGGHAATLETPAGIITDAGGMP
ncbi:MAG: proline racemase family protein [Gemmatimonadaceae bacterium]